jgi:hypothetical protein
METKRTINDFNKIEFPGGYLINENIRWMFIIEAKINTPIKLYWLEVAQGVV